MGQRIPAEFGGKLWWQEDFQIVNPSEKDFNKMKKTSVITIAENIEHPLYRVSNLTVQNDRLAA